jgi:hypothetical protein
LSAQRFDELTKTLADGTASRRKFLAGLGTVAAAVLVGPRGAGAIPGDAPGSGDCANQGQSCTAQKCCAGFDCLTDLTSSTEKFCCSPTSTLVCGRSCCPTGALGNCSAGQCVCPLGEVVCPDANNPLAGKCVNLAEDPDNCGACGTVCGGPTGPDAPCRVRACVNGGCTTVPNPAVIPGVTPCEDGDVCTLGDTCNNAGTCQPGPVKVCVQCQTCANVEGVATCVPDPAQVGDSCDDENACTESDVCTGTAAAPTGVCAGTVITCDDNNPCTTDTCNPASGCVFTPVTDNTLCGTNQICCQSGQTSVCVSNQTKNNCGVCGTQCGAGEDCCGGVCTALNTGTNCGACGVVCNTANCEICAADANGQFRCTSTCVAGQECVNGSCVPTCRPGTCSGCCQNNVCQAGTSNLACGTGGSVCAACPAGTQCQGGSCVPVCSVATCPGGCCQNNICQPGTSPQACRGEQPGTCVTCGTGMPFCCPPGSARRGCARATGAECSNDNQCCNSCVPQGPGQPKRCT